jgi:hypothetical protein
MPLYKKCNETQRQVARKEKRDKINTTHTGKSNVSPLISNCLHVNELNSPIKTE